MSSDGQYGTGTFLGHKAVLLAVVEDPADTPAGKGYLYLKIDGRWYVKNGTAVETLATGNDVIAYFNAAAAALGAHTTDTTDAHAASAITNTPAGSVAATNVQAAINELATEYAAAVASLQSQITANGASITSLNSTVAGHTSSIAANAAAVAAATAWTTGSIGAGTTGSLISASTDIRRDSMDIVHVRFASTWDGGAVLANDEGGLTDVNLGVVPAGFRCDAVVPWHGYVNTNAGLAGGYISTAGNIWLTHIGSNDELANGDVIYGISIYHLTS